MQQADRVTGNPDAALLQSLRQRVLDTLAAALPAGQRRVAVLDFPYHKNAGDSAIWVGERIGFRTAGLDIGYVCHLTAYDRRRVVEAVGDAPILLHGGGSFGDVWPVFQEFRERVLYDFPDRPVVQMPQTIKFHDPAALERARAAVNQHPNFTLLARDAVSEEFARREFPNARVLLCPDMAFLIGAMPRPVAPTTDVLVLGRTDHEATGSLASAVSGIPHEVVDWELGRWGDARFKAHMIVPKTARMLRTQARVWHGLQRSVSRHYEAMADLNVSTAFRTLSRGRVVVTDRLHAHILALLLGVPHVLVDNNYGKLSSYSATWTFDSRLARYASTESEARDAVEQLLASTA